LQPNLEVDKNMPPGRVIDSILGGRSSFLGEISL